MKKLLLLCTATLALQSTSYAQQLYTRIGLGYAIPQAGQTMDGTATPYNGSAVNSSPSGSTTYSLKNMSFGAGVHGDLGFGYMFNKHVGIDVSLDFLLSAKQYTGTIGNVLVDSVPSNVNMNQKGKCTLFIPALVLQSDGEKMNLYTRVGIALPLRSRVTWDEVYVNLPGTGATEVVDFTWEIKNKLSLGLAAAIGAKFAVNNKMKFWCEMGFLSFAPYTKEANLTEVSVNGQGGYLNQISAAQRVITYSTAFTGRTNDFFHQPAYSQPFSNFSINAGLSFDLQNNGRGRQRGKNDVKSRRR